MATTKASAKKPVASRATATKKSTVKKAVVKKSVIATAQAAAVTPPKKLSLKSTLFPTNLPNIILSELLGTFVLTAVAFMAFAVSPFAASKAGVLSNLMVDPLFIGLTLMVLVMGFGAISGAHLNPAVTFGLWSMRKLKSVMVPVYWLSQFLGALLAVGIVNVLTGGQFIVSLANFVQFNLPLFFIELIGTAIFMFGLASVLSRSELSVGSKAFGIGTSLAIALVAGVSLLAPVQKADVEKYQADVAKVSSNDSGSLKIPRTVLVNSAVLNPAIAIAVTENGSDQAQPTDGSTKANHPASRFGLEVILGSLIGAALGGNLYLLVAYRPKDEV